MGYISWPRWRGAEPLAKVKRDQGCPRPKRGSFSRCRSFDNHEAGSGRPLAKEAQDANLQHPTHTTAASISTPEPSFSTSSTTLGGPRRAVWHRRGSDTPLSLLLRCDADGRTIPVQPGDARRSTCGVRMRADFAGNCLRTGTQPDPESSFLFNSVGHESGSAALASS